MSCSIMIPPQTVGRDNMTATDSNAARALWLC
jgi:hypothetical protein